MQVRGVTGFALAFLAGLACARPSIPPPAPAESAAAPSAAPSRPATPPTGLEPAPEPPVEPVTPPTPTGPVPAPEIRFTDLAGLRGEIEALRAQQRPVLVNFWATWCGACVHELPLLGDLAREWGGAGPAILGVSLDHLTVPDDDRIKGRVRQMLLTHRVSYPNRIVRGDQQEVFDTFGIADGIPFSLFYDGEGEVVGRYRGSVVIDDARGIARSLAAARDPAPDPEAGG